MDLATARQNEQPRGFADLTDAEIAAFRSQLAQRLDPAEAESITWLRRAVLMPDGTWRLIWRQPKQADLGQFRDRPWGYETGGLPTFREKHKHAGMATEVGSAPLAEAVALLTSGRNPEHEVMRREALFDAAWATIDERAQREAEAARSQRAAAEEHQRRRPERWAALSQLQKALLVVAAGQYHGHRQAFLALARLLGLPATSPELTNVPDAFEGSPS